MARTDLTKTVAPGTNDYTGIAVTFAAADQGDGNQFTAQGKDLVLAWNKDASPHTVTITSSPDERGRTQNITAVSVAAGAIMAFGPLELMGWIQTDGKVYLSGSNANLFLAAIKLPG